MKCNLLFSGPNSVYRRMGYYKDQEGILRRYYREKEQWEPHLKNTKEVILRTAQNKSRHKAAVLGSGWLLDVPVKELSEMFDEVWLFDIKHPAVVQRKIKGFSNIKLIETDISGFAKPVFETLRASKGPFKTEMIRPTFDFDLTQFSYVVSCNILNQLDILILDYMKAKMHLAAEEECKVRALIQQTHLQLLPEKKSCLISDTEELWIDANRIIQNRKSLIYTGELPTRSEKWTWYFDNRYTYQEKYNTWFEVHAYEL